MFATTASALLVLFNGFWLFYHLTRSNYSAATFFLILTLCAVFGTVLNHYYWKEGQ